MTSTLFPGLDDQSYVLGLVLDITERKKAEQKLKETNQILEHLSNVDGLTSVLNRRNFEENLSREWMLAIRESTPLSLILIDIDHFKDYNDTYGHLQGDDCLRQVAEVLKSAINQPTDFVARYGGEEFAILLPKTDGNGALLLAEKLRAQIEALQIPHEGSKVSHYVTISAGVAAITPEYGSLAKELISNTDQALYQAKKEGRNRVSPYTKA